MILISGVSRIVCCAWLAGAVAAYGQSIESTGCAEDAEFYEEADYRLAEDAEFRGGFSFLRSIRRIAESDSDPSLKKGAPLNLQALRDFVGRLQAELSAASQERFHFSYVQSYLDRCDDPAGANPELHVNFLVFDSTPALPAFRVFESRRQENSNPIEAAGAPVRGTQVKFVPRIGGNSSDHIFGGGSFEVTSGGRFLNTITAEILASRSGSRINTEMAGERDWDAGYVQSAAWKLGFQRTDRPTTEGNLIDGHVYTLLQLNSRPLGPSQAVIRFASQFAGGNAQADFAHNVLGANTVASAANQTWKNAFGLTSRIGAHSFSASYGLQLGRVGRGRTVDYRKHIGDFAFSTHKLVGDHKLIEYETRFTAGALKIPGTVPVGERFFGGNREADFLDGPDFSENWRIRSNPVVRGIAANQMNRVSPAPVIGGEGFIAWNNTIALPLPFFNQPLLPRSLTESQEFSDALELQRSLNRSALIVSYTTHDPAFKRAVERIPDVDAELARLSALISGIAGSDAAAKPDADSCVRVIRDRRAILDEAAEAMDVVVNNDDSAVIGPVLACAENVQKLHNDPAFEAPLAALRSLRAEISSRLAEVNTSEVTRLAEQDMRLANRVMDVFFKEASIVSVNPVVVFDMARLAGPEHTPDWLGVRYSIGGGIRVQFLRLLNLTAGYAANPRRRADEKPGAFFFSMDLLDLFR